MFTVVEKPVSETEETEKPSPWAGSLGAAMDKARAKLSGTSKRASKTKESGTDTSSRRNLSEDEIAKVRAMFSPEAWRTIVKTPFVLGRVITGRSCWDLDQKEEDSLATTTAASAEYFLQTDPKWVCLSICMFNWSVILTSKFIANATAVKQEQLQYEDHNKRQAA